MALVLVVVSSCELFIEWTSVILITRYILTINMSILFSLLSLPQTSNGFTSLRPTAVNDTLYDASASISRKVPRLDTDSDSATASRPNSKSQQLKASKGPIKIEI